jgi:hypothetical protein
MRQCGNLKKGKGSDRLKIRGKIVSRKEGERKLTFALSPLEVRRQKRWDSGKRICNHFLKPGQLRELIRLIGLPVYNIQRFR